MSVRIYQARSDEPAWQPLGAGRRFSSEPASVIYPQIGWPVAIRKLRGSHRP